MNINKDSAVMRGLRTGVQAIIGFLVGLVVVVWQVPTVPEVVMSYVTNNIGALMAALGVSAGVVSFVWNFFRKDVPNV